MMKYERCEECKQIVKKEDGETIGQCPYCGSERGFVRVSEKVWRMHYIGIVMQPFVYNHIRVSSQTTFIKELVE